MSEHPGLEYAHQTPRSPILLSMPPLVLFIISMITRGLFVCCAGPDMELMEGLFLSARIFFFCFLYILDRICAVVY